jgi:hypothetical protein
MYTLTNASSLPLNLNVCIHTYDICQLAGCQEEETALFFFHPKIYNNIIFLSFESFPEDFFMFILFYFICPFFLPAPKNVEEIVTVQDGGWNASAGAGAISGLPEPEKGLESTRFFGMTPAVAACFCGPYVSCCCCMLLRALSIVLLHASADLKYRSPAWRLPLLHASADLKYRAMSFTMKDYQTSNLPLYGGVRNASPAYVACQKTNSPSSALVRFKKSHGSDLSCHRNTVSLLESSTTRQSLSSYYPHAHI